MVSKCVPCLLWCWACWPASASQHLSAAGMPGAGNNIVLDCVCVQSYNSYLDEPLRGINVYGGLTSQKTDGSYQSLKYVAAAKLDMEGAPLCQL